MSKGSRKTRAWGSILSQSSDPIYMVGIDRKLIGLNVGCQQLTGRSADELLGRVCEYVSDADPSTVESLLGALCPPPEVFAGETLRMQTFVTDSRGRAQQRTLNLFPLHDENNTVVAVLGIVTQATRPREQTAASPAHRLHAELAALRIRLQQKFNTKTLLCNSPPMHRVLHQIAIGKACRDAVHLFGEAGTGKEHIARVIHYESESGRSIFVPFDCQAIPAREMKQALRRLQSEVREEEDLRAIRLPAQLYLASVEFLARDLQERLLVELHVNQAAAHMHLRMMSSSTIPLERAVEQDRLLPEFHYLLTPIQIDLPPLRNRREDFPLLAQHFLEAENRGTDKQLTGIADEVWPYFWEYNWPGNLDELATVVSEMRRTAKGPELTVENLPFRFRAGLASQAVGPAPAPAPISLEKHLNEVEADHIRRALEQAGGNRSQAAELLGLTRARLYRRMEALGIEP
mgnify:CR=1 FL=1